MGPYAKDITHFRGNGGCLPKGDVTPFSKLGDKGVGGSQKSQKRGDILCVKSNIILRKR